MTLEQQREAAREDLSVAMWIDSFPQNGAYYTDLTLATLEYFESKVRDFDEPTLRWLAAFRREPDA